METVETRVSKSCFSGIKGAKKERKMLEKSSTSYLGPGCREFESRHSDQKSADLDQNQPIFYYHKPLVEEIIFLNHINLIKGSENYFITALFFVYCIPIFIRTSQTIQFDMLAYMLFCRFHHEKLLDTHLPYIRTDRKSMHSYQRRIHLLP